MLSATVPTFLKYVLAVQPTEIFSRSVTRAIVSEIFSKSEAAPC